MTGDDLDRTYTALCEALGRVGPEHASLLLATLSLALMARQTDVDEVERLIGQAERLVQGDGKGAIAHLARLPHA